MLPPLLLQPELLGHYHRFNIILGQASPLLKHHSHQLPS
jgi:hypothetical protein